MGKEVSNAEQKISILSTAEITSPSVGTNLVNPGTNYPQVTLPNADLKDEVLLNALGALTISRCILLVTGESKNLGLGTMQRYTAVFIPVFISYSLFRTIYTARISGNTLATRLVQMIVIGVYFGLGYAIPSSFNSNNDLLSTLVCFLTAARLLYTAIGVLRVELMSKWSRFVTTISLLPIIPWLAAIFLDGSFERNAVFITGVVIDFGAYVFLLYKDERFREPNLERNESKIFRPSLLIAILGYLFQTNQLLIFKDAFSTIVFNIYDFIVGIFLFITIFCMHLISDLGEFHIYNSSVRSRAKYLVNQILVLFSIGYFVCFAALIQIEADAMYNSSESNVGFPVLISILPNTTALLTTPGVAYLDSLVSLSNNTKIEQSSNLIFILPILALFGITQSIIILLHYKTGESKKHSRYFVAFLFSTSVILGFFSLIRTSWAGVGRDLLLLFVAVYYIVMAGIVSVLL